MSLCDNAVRLDLQRDEPTPANLGERRSLENSVLRQLAMPVDPQTAVDAFEVNPVVNKAAARPLEQPKGAPAISSFEARKSRGLTFFHSNEETFESIIEAFQGPPSHLRWAGAKTIRVVASDLSQRFLLVEAGDRYLRLSPCFNTFLQGGIVKLTLLFEQRQKPPMLARRRPKKIPITHQHGDLF